MNKTKTKAQGIAVSAFRTKSGDIGELVFRADTGQTAFAVSHDNQVSEHNSWQLDGTGPIVPIPGSNNLLRHRVVLLPERATPLSSVEDLIAELGEHLDRYVDLSAGFRTVTIHYILLTWVYDAFNELPYLRFRGEPGCGKTRALTVVGSLCYQAFLVSGASTVSPIFHTLDTFRGTFVFDEADFRFSDEKLELVKILNNGNVRGCPVLRSVPNHQKVFDPKAFHVYGPKIIAMRHSFEDGALESRLLTEEMGQRPHRPDIPLNLPDCQAEEARALRNKLLSYRFHTLPKITVRAELARPELSSRMNQILVPLLSVTINEAARAAIIALAAAIEARGRSEKSQSPEALLLTVLMELFAEVDIEALPLLAITRHLQARFGADFDRPITPRYVGSLLRTRLHLVTYKTKGVFVLPRSEAGKVEVLACRYGLILEQSGDSAGGIQSGL